ncbi:GDP-mannose 4,6-dehydratase [Chromobacterium haemolyticum]|uniref:GDP-mannose 4,6-dehydratase n=1 Tax=Chromobacterium haemolyticum TaxID=394935 RepID=UPI000DEEEE2C|nr:GDP-mannose 4,6-dehydratase [Chromobacterium haemolyticum]
MKLLITGGCGFLGSNLASHALFQGIDLCIFDSLYRYGSQSNLQWLRGQGNFEFVHGDIRNPNDVQRAIAYFMPDAVFHLAGQVAMTTSIVDPRMDFEVNALGTLNLLESVRTHVPNAAVIYSSTNKVYGDLEQYQYQETSTRYICVDHPNGFSEQTPLNFQSPYGCSKGAADQYLLDYHRIFGLKTVVFRHSSMYGGRQFATVDQGWIGWFCKMAAEAKAGSRKEPFTISGNGKQVRDVLHADDMISLYFSTLQHIETVSGQPFNIGGGNANSLSLLELFNLLEAKIEMPMLYSKLPPRESDQRVFVASLDKIRSLTGWEPNVSACEGVSKMLSWVSGNLN